MRRDLRRGMSVVVVLGLVLLAGCARTTAGNSQSIRTPRPSGQTSPLAQTGEVQRINLGGLVVTVDSTSNPSAVPLHIYAHSKIPTIAPGSSKRFLVVIATATNSTETTMNNVRFPFVLTDSSGHELRPVVGYGSVIGNSSAAFGTLRPRASTEMSGV
jgi:hypothetical protein